MDNRKPKVFVVDTRPSGLRFEPRAGRLTHAGHLVLWEATFFESGSDGKTYCLFVFADGHQAWMRQEAWACLKDFGKRKPFDVARDLVLAEAPPLEQLKCPTRSIHGSLTTEQAKIMNALTDFLS
jgi:hypothetical protein